MKAAFLVTLLALTAGISFAQTKGERVRVVHVFVALADNDHQGIIPVPARLGNGTDPENNLYWGAAFGVKTYFGRSAQWQLVRASKDLRADTVLERCVFKHRQLPLYLVADAYKGERIKEAVSDFLASVAGRAEHDSIAISESSKPIGKLACTDDLVVYVGHEGLMDFALPIRDLRGDSTGKQAIILACMSRQYFSRQLTGLKADPVLWTTGLMAPEAYTLHAAVQCWGEGKSREEIRTEAAAAYDHFQHCSVTAAKRLLVTGFGH